MCDQPPSNRLVSTSPRTLTGAAVLMVTAIFGSRVLGLVREAVMFGLFGRGGGGALRAAFYFPDLLYFLLAGGALRTGFMPIFTRLLNEGEESRAWRAFSLLCTTVFTVSLLVVGLGILFAGPLTGIISTGFASEELRRDTFRAAQVIFPAQMAMLLGGLFSGVLNAMGNFLLPALVPIIYNLSLIGGMLLLGPWLGIRSAAVGALVGAWSGHFLLQIWGLRQKGVRFRPQIALHNPDFIEVLQLAWPIVLGLCIAEINVKISGTLAGRWFGEAGLGAFEGAVRVSRLPDGVFGAALGIALFPIVSVLAAQGRREEFRRQMETTLRLALLCALPSAVALTVLRRPIIGALYGYGKMGGADVEAVAALLPIFALSVVPITLQALVTRGFYALKDTLTPVKVGAIAVLVGVGLNFGLGWLLGLPGVALALALTTVLNLTGLLWLYGRRIGWCDGRGMRRLVGLAAGGSGLLALVAWLVTILAQNWLGQPRGLLSFLPLLAGGVAGGGVYVLLLRAWQVPEWALLTDLLRQLLSRLRGTKGA